MDPVQWLCGRLFLSGSVVGISLFFSLDFFSFQSAGISHSCLLKKVAGFLRSMLCTLQTWNLFGGFADNYYSAALWLAFLFFPPLVFFSPSSLQKSLTPAC